MILIVDDEQENRDSLEALLKREGWKCHTAKNGDLGLEALRQHQDIQILITDLKMPGGMNGLELLEMSRVIRPDVHRILVTAYGTIEDTVLAMKKGAFDVISKPLKIKILKDKIRKLLNTKAPLKSPDHKHISRQYAEALELTQKAANTNACVTIYGEDGTGKSYLAKFLHEWSSRTKSPYFAFHCASVAPHQLEETLFGSSQTKGLLQNTSGGTLYLKEVSKLSLPVQIKLYQFLKDKKFFPVGSHDPIESDLRIIASSSYPLEKLIQEGHFQKELFFKLNVIPIRLAPLRERKEDLLWLVPSLMNRLCEKNKTKPVGLHQKCFEKFWTHHWPENIRELENVLESALVMAPPEHIQEGFLYPEDFHMLKSPEEENPLPSSKLPSSFPDLAAVEKQVMEQALAITGGNRRLSAKLLGISERTLYRSLKEQ